MDSWYEEKTLVPFNPNSPAQVKQLLLTQYQLELESTDDDHLQPYADLPFVQDMIAYRKAAKQVSTYGLAFLKNVEPDSRIYTSLNIGLAESGRDSSSSPNLQNIPKDVARRACFVAGEGKELVLFDYSGQEAGTWAYITGDEKFKEIINSGKKLYIEVARIAFNEEIKKGTHRYDIIKALVLGLMYGLSPYGFARDNGVEIEVAEEMFKAFMTGFPTSARWIEEQQARNKGVALTILGRHAHLHPYDRQWKNNALNTPNQGSGGDMIKLAMKKLRYTDFYKTYYPEGKICILLQVHDEILCEVDEELAEEWAEIMKSVMIGVAESLTPGVKGGVSGGVIENWSQKD
jgi:DNA polymerase-1